VKYNINIVTTDFTDYTDYIPEEKSVFICATPKTGLPLA
jgi:hypothetical protein